MKKFLLGTIILLGSVGIASAQSEDRDPRAPKAQKAATAVSENPAKQAAQQEELNARKNRPSQASLRAKAKKSEATTATPATAVTKPQPSSNAVVATKSKTNNTATKVVEKRKDAVKVDAQSADVKAAEASKPNVIKKN